MQNNFQHLTPHGNIIRRHTWLAYYRLGLSALQYFNSSALTLSNFQCCICSILSIITTDIFFNYQVQRRVQFADKC